ncbi:hypothetical protein Hanom_Chr07g00669541 [Helianthus anomalus]
MHFPNTNTTRHRITTYSPSSGTVFRSKTTTSSLFFTQTSPSITFPEGSNTFPPPLPFSKYFTASRIRRKIAKNSSTSSSVGGATTTGSISTSFPFVSLSFFRSPLPSSTSLLRFLR